MVNVDNIPCGKQLCYDYCDRRDFGEDMHWLKETNESSDDEGKFASAMII